MTASLAVALAANVNVISQTARENSPVRAADRKMEGQSKEQCAGRLGERE